MKVLAREKKISKAPNWTTFFTKKEVRVLYRIEFYSRNDKGVAFAGYKTYEKDCDCSESTILRAIKKGDKLGVIENQTKTTRYVCPRTGLTFFSKSLKIKWLGDVPFTKGSLIFTRNEGHFEGHFEGLIHKNKELLKEREDSPLSSFEEQVREKLREYPKSQIKELIETSKAKYETKQHFLLLDLPGILNRFKRENPLKTCTLCGEPRESGGAWCNACYLNQKVKQKLKAEEYQIQGFLKTLGFKIEPKDQREIDALNEAIGRHKTHIDFMTSEFQKGLISSDVYETILLKSKDKIQELEGKLNRLRRLK